MKTTENSLQSTPQANRLHIALYGKRNSGKSSLLNCLTGQQAALVSDIAGTTTDPVYKSMELHGIGPCVFIDTAGFDDEGQLGKMRVEKTSETSEKADMALLLVNGETLKGDTLSQELKWGARLQLMNIPIVLLLTKSDLLSPEALNEANAKLSQVFGMAALAISSHKPETVEHVRQAVLRMMPEDFEKQSITGALANPGDLILLVVPQDIQAPKGRLILPQVQTIRDLLDKKCIVVSCTADTLDASLSSLSKEPDLIITDSQIFPAVYEKKPASSKLTSFSILFADYKGDLPYYTKSATAIDSLTEQSRILIAEACTHAPLTEDIGRVKLPMMLRKKAGEGLSVDFVRGNDFPQDLRSYDLIIQCGACMFNRRYVLSRTTRAKEQGVPMTNYGVALAHLTGVLEHLDI